MSWPSGWDRAVGSIGRDADDGDRRERELIEEQHAPVVCPQCMGEAMLLGQLGRVVHLRCRACGWEFTENEGIRQEWS